MRNYKKSERLDWTLERLEGDGYLPWVVESYNASAKRSLDLYNFIDVLALKDLEPILAIQVIAGKLNQRLEELKENKYLEPWLLSGNKFEIWYWSKDQKLHRNPIKYGVSLDTYKRRVYPHWVFKKKPKCS